MAQIVATRCTPAQARLLASLVIYGPARCPREHGPNQGKRLQFRVRDTCEKHGWIQEQRGGSCELYRFAITEAGREVLRGMWRKIWQSYSYEPIHPVQI